MVEPLEWRGGKLVIRIICDKRMIYFLFFSSSFLLWWWGRIWGWINLLKVKRTNKKCLVVVVFSPKWVGGMYHKRASILASQVSSCESVIWLLCRVIHYICLVLQFLLHKPIRNLLQFCLWFSSNLSLGNISRKYQSLLSEIMVMRTVI